MELLIIRHGQAGEREDWRATGRPDSERPLTKDGRRKTRAAARGLRELVDGVDLVVSSPWTRAAQTAELVAEALGGKLATLDALIPDRPYDDTLAWLKTRKEKRIALVGHEPHLSGLATWLMCGLNRPILNLKKSQALLIELKKPQAGTGKLAWSIPPRQLRALKN